MISLAETAWLAGFIDGEGSFGLHTHVGRKMQLCPSFSMNNTHFATMSIVIDLMKKLGIRYVAGIKRRHCEGRKDQVYLYVKNKDGLVKLLKTIEPHLVTKKLQVLLMLRYFQIHKSFAHATEEEFRIADEIKELNAYGRMY